MTVELWPGSPTIVAVADLLAGVGLDTADKLASVLGLFVGLGSLAAAVFVLVRRHRAADDSSGQSVANSSVGGDSIQIGSARNVVIHRGR